MISPQALIFDLDGTLIDSLQDIADAMNRVLAAHNFSTHSYADYREFIGRGLKNLVERCLPADQHKPEMMESCHQALMREYRAKYVVKTRLYPGIRELLEQISLKYAAQQEAAPNPSEQINQATATNASASKAVRKNKRYPMAILSNKADEITQLIAQELGLIDYFDLILGATPRYPRKPGIESSLYLAQQLGCQPAEVLYVGDSGIDMQTAKNAGMTALGVSWGFRSRQELLDQGADFVVNSPEEILALI